MSTFTDRIKLVFEAATGQATAGVAALDRSLESAGKTTTGFTGTLNRVGGALDVMGPQVLATAGAAFVGFGIKAVKAFQDSAIAASDLADATGLTTEEASRWQEVAGDAGVSTEALASAVGKMNKAAGKGELHKLGIDAQGTNEQFLATIQYLDGITDAGKREVEGTKLLGKGWSELAPLIQDAAGARADLAAVSDEQVFDDLEVARAKSIRDLTDQISDAFGRAQLAAGGYFAGVIEGAGDLGKLITDGADKTSLWGKAWGVAKWNLERALEPVITLGTALPELADHMNEQEAAATKAADGIRSLRAAGVEEAETLDDVTAATVTATDATDKLRNAMLKGRSAARDYRGAQADATEALLIYMSKGAQPAASDTDTFAAAIDGLADAALNTPGGMAAALGSIGDLQRSTQRGSPAWSALEDLRVQLLTLQQPTLIKVDVDARRAQVQLDSLNRQLRDLAAGTTITASTSVRAGIRRNGVAFN
jgi:hypothetical protein